MDDLRSEIRAAFEREQAAHPPAGSLRSNLTAAAATQSRPARNLQWIAVAVAAVLAILVVAGLMSTRLGHRASVPAATPQAGAVKDYGPPPAGVPLTYLIDPRNGAWLQAYDWQGQPRGTVKLAQPVVRGYRTVFAAPDGSGFVYQPQGEGGVTQYLDRLGRPIASGLLPSPPGSAWLWADDSRHLCVVRFASPSGEWQLYTMLPGGTDHLVGILPTGPVSLASCSFRNDQAIVVNGTPTCCGIQSPSELWVFRISDGKVLSDYTYAFPNSVATVVASSDGVLIAENSTRSAGQPGASPSSTVIRRVSDWSVVTSLDPSLQVLLFSGDDSLVFVGSGPLSTGQPILLSVIDVRTGQVTWHEQGALMTGMEQPNGRDFQISLDAGPGTTGPLGAFLIIHGDGSVTSIPGSYTPA
ncbi:MAG TPA: hypothetical protein VGU71_19190 [Candidatus Dormibacteraeota bacterium]|nr:hypothetical protein [Candidatus Dormibacteraeota bacterium]